MKELLKYAAGIVIGTIGTVITGKVLKKRGAGKGPEKDSVKTD